MVHGAVWAGEPHIKGRSEPVRMMFLCTGLIGLQLAWGELSCSDRLWFEPKLMR